jgi:NADH:ubiquinone reductase (H+-translocating)
MEASHHIVIIGGGFGGLYAARALKRAPARVTLVDRTNYHLFQPLLYQVATGGLSPANIAAPLRAVLYRQKNTNVVMAEVVDIDVGARRLILREESQLDLRYDTLIVASGSKFNYFGHDPWSEFAPGLKTIEDALTIRRRVLSAFEQAELEADPARQKACMTFVVVGAGPTGVEMAGALAELAHHTLRRDFRNIRPTDATILLVEAQDHLLGQFPPDLQRKAEKALERLGVTVCLGTTVTQLDPRGATVKTGERIETIAAGAVLWTAGVKASRLGAALAQATGLRVDRVGRLAVEPDLSLPGHGDIFVIGDLASFSHQTPQPLPGLAPVAMQEGRYVAKVICRRLKGKKPPNAFRYFDRGNMATIGRAAAVADLGWLHISGHLAWLTWLFVHLMYLAQFQNRVLVLIQWAYSYLTRGRAARLITQEPPRVDR